MLLAIIVALTGCTQSDANKREEISQAIEQRDEKKAIQLLQSVDNVDFDYGYGNGITALHMAVSRNLSKLSAYLIEHGANTSTEDNLGVQPIHIAASNGYLIIVKQLIDSGVDINVRNREGMTPLLFAASHCDKPLVVYLLSKGANGQLKADKYTDVISLSEGTMNWAEENGQPEKVKMCKEVVELLIPHSHLANPTLGPL